MSTTNRCWQTTQRRRHNLIATALISERLREAMACTSLVAAKSGTKGKLRPLQTGTTLRRLVGATLVAHDKENLRQTVEQAQFAVAEPAGIELMEHTMQALMEARGDLAWLQLDCTNAFGELSREKCLQSLRNKMPHLLACEAQWLTQPTRAISRNEKGDTMQFRKTAGLDQGDPFSPVAFAATLPLGDLQNAIPQAQRVAGIGRPATGCFSFLDDLTLAVSHEAGETARQLARGKLAAVGLRLNTTKCMIYTLSQVAPPGMEDCWEQTKRHDGLIIAGRPYSIEEESLETSFEGVGTVGENKFVEDFAETVKTKIVTALKPLEQLTARAQVGQPARQAANVLLHHCAAAKAAHLLRMLPLHSTGEV